MEQKIINKKKYYVNQNEFNIIPHVEYNNLKIISELGLQERIIGLINELSNTFSNTNLLIYNTTHGGFIPINCNYISNIFLFNTLEEHKLNILNNIKLHNIQNIRFIDTIQILNMFLKQNNLNIILDIYGQYNETYSYENSIIITSKLLNHNNSIFVSYTWSKTGLFLYIPLNIHNIFYESFHYFIKGETNNFEYDNLNHLCIMVKNGGPQFEEMLTNNIDYFDRWTILDTGSTDNTIEIVQKVLVGKKKGELIQEPFINFRDSRNRLLDLAGTYCKYITMLDDTYVIDGNLRGFLNTVRGDQYADSFTLYISSDDTIYGSNRIIKSESNLRYIHKIHEVITDKNNSNVVIPLEQCKIIDKRFDYMEQRTMERKQLDLKLLFEEVEDDPNNPRSYYYLGQTYNLLEDYEKSYFYFLKRGEFINAGFLQERFDATFEAARIANFKLNKSWEECLKLYEKAHQIDDSRPEPLYFIGIHYYLESDYNKAYNYLKKGFELGFPSHTQYSLKPTLSYHFLPKFLTRVCYHIPDYQLGEKASMFFLEHNNEDVDDYQEVVSWYQLFTKLNIYKGNKTPKVPEKPILCFVADGGFNKWSGSNILTTGVGGSETYIIEMARYIQKQEYFNVYVFCNCESEEVFENVQYKHLDSYPEFIYTNYVSHVIVSRYSEYLPLTYDGWSENVYLVVHDLTPSGIVIPINPKLKNIFCLTEWHVEHMSQVFPQLKHLLVPFYYGIDSKFILNDTTNKIPYSFIYSSFPNRGLLPLLQMWPKIYDIQPLASLDIYSDIDGLWVNNVAKEQMNEIRKLLNEYKNYPNSLNIYYHGWVPKNVLAEAWKKADIWFYPCIFMETFCLTALEAAASKVLCITNDLAALQNTVGNRGIIIEGNPMSNEWQNKALQQIYFIMNETNKTIRNKFINDNFGWAVNQTWMNQANKLLDEYILTNKLEYKGMYNWTYDLPKGSKEVFLSIINYFVSNYCKNNKYKKIIVLEIGSYNGTSLINIIKNIPNSIGYAIDKWENYNESVLTQNIVNLQVKKSFIKNIETEDLTNKIFTWEGISFDILLELNKTNDNNFDFIYVDGSHLCLDVYIDLMLVWNLLNKGGILAIDDYTFKQNDILKSPFEAINHFFKVIEGKYKMLHKNYRVFIEKL
jgi:hypothetical protein